MRRSVCATRREAGGRRPEAASAKRQSCERLGDGNALVNVGFAYVSGGQFDTGIPMMEQGIAKGGLRRTTRRSLHLGIAYLSAGTQGGRRPDVSGCRRRGRHGRARAAVADLRATAELTSSPGIAPARRPLRFLLQALTRTPLPVLYAWGWVFHVIVFHIVRWRRDQVASDIALAFPDKPARSARASCASPIATSPTS
jgi:hypothetical protein